MNDDKKLKRHYQTIVLRCYEKRVLVDVVFLLLHCWELYFRVVPFFPQLRYDEQWVPWLFLGHSDHDSFW